MTASSSNPVLSELVHLLGPLGATIVFDLGFLGFGAFFFGLIVFPYFKEKFKRDMIPISEGERWGYRFKVIDFLFDWIPEYTPLKKGAIRVHTVESRFRSADSTRSALYWIGDWVGIRFSMFVYFFLRMSAIILVVTVTAFLMTSVGLHYQLTEAAIVFDLVYAKANALPNGAHVSSYLALMLVSVTVLVKFKDEMLALLTAGFGMSFHESFWIVFYWLAYGRYYNFSLWENVAKDIAFFIMCGLIIFTFWKYRYQKMPMRIFLWPAIIYLIGLCLWFAVPHLIDPTKYSWLPITTLNNPHYGVGPYDETPWYSDLLTNFFESGSWIGLLTMCEVQVLRLKKK